MDGSIIVENNLFNRMVLRKWYGESKFWIKDQYYIRVNPDGTWQSMDFEFLYTQSPEIKTLEDPILGYKIMT